MTNLRTFFFYKDLNIFSFHAQDCLVDEAGLFTEAAGSELQKKDVLGEGNETGLYYILHYKLGMAKNIDLFSYTRDGQLFFSFKAHIPSRIIN